MSLVTETYTRYTAPASAEAPSCSVCLDPSNTAENPLFAHGSRTLHPIHERCMDTWASTRANGGEEPNCPACRAQVVWKDIHPSIAREAARVVFASPDLAEQNPSGGFFLDNAPALLALGTQFTLGPIAGAAVTAGIAACELTAGGGRGSERIGLSAVTGAAIRAALLPTGSGTLVDRVVFQTCVTGISAIVGALAGQCRRLTRIGMAEGRHEGSIVGAFIAKAAFSAAASWVFSGALSCLGFS